MSNLLHCSILFLLTLPNYPSKIRGFCELVSYNDHGLLLCRYLKNGQPGNWSRLELWWLNLVQNLIIKRSSRS